MGDRTYYQKNKHKWLEYHARRKARGEEFRVACREATKRWELKNPEKKKKIYREWWKKNKDKARLSSSNWRSNNPSYAADHYRKNADKKKSQSVAWQKRNPDRVKISRDRSAEKNRASIRLRDSLRKKKFPEKFSAQNAARKAIKIRAMPKWANRFFISEAYHLAALRTKMFGYPWHVDHIVPLQSQLVCGLHVEHNLRVIPGRENIIKGNRHWPGMP